MRKWVIALLVCFLSVVVFLDPACSKERQDNLPEVPAEGMVTMLDLGAKKCIPCKMMAPILEKLKREYKGKAAIIFIDVWVHREEARKYGIRAIPTQIFFDKNGNEVYRHVGFMSEEAIVKQFEKMGVNQAEKKSNMECSPLTSRNKNKQPRPEDVVLLLPPRGGPQGLSVIQSFSGVLE